MTEHLPPYQIAHQGRLVDGLSYQMMYDVLLEAGIEATFEVMPWARAFEEAQHAPNVLIFSIIRSPEREPLFEWIDVLFTERYHIYANQPPDALALNSLDQAKGLIAAATRGSYEEEALLKLGFRPGKNLILAVDHDDVWGLLQRNRAQLAYASEQIFNRYSKRHPTMANKLYPLGVIQDVKQLWLAASLDTRPETIALIRTVLKSVKQRPQYAHLTLPDPF
ncbi:substrate-binding periplasmic protein [Fluctibacter halophilus]|uniref:substrate-binding periplasmic protein n=1 Tax=Fluctibacter halophilus TaxID=226011 RepID=UPI001E5531C9|nr:transporter substrate-binding domain-containing protein [Aestuariibacter halophilus]